MDPLIGIAPIMDFANAFYERNYATGSRETFRRFTIHQFVQAGIVLQNPDLPTRPVNSPQTVYQIEPGELLSCYGITEAASGKLAWNPTWLP